MAFPRPQELEARFNLNITADDISTLRSVVSSDYRPGRPVNISCAQLKSPEAALRTFLGKHGWAVKREYDQRDGDYYVITAA